MFSFKAPVKTRRMLMMMKKELPKRAEAMQRYFVYQMAEQLRVGVQKRLPSGAEYAALRDSFEVVRGNSVEPIYAVRSAPVEEAASKLDAKKTVIYVKAKTAAGFRIPPDVLVLEAYSPWTLDTLPFRPSARHATFVHRRVSEREVDRVRKARIREKPKWRRELFAKGAREKGSSRKLDLSRVRSVPDTAFSSLNLEFGMGTKSAPHWRPALAGIRRGMAAKKVTESVPYQRALSDPKFRAWRQWKRLGETKVALSELAKYQAFQDRLGLT